MTRGFAILLLSLWAACGPMDEEPAPSVDAGTASLTVTLGTCDSSLGGFYPLAGEQPLRPGSQAGFHVWLKYRVSGHQPGTKVRVKRSARRISDDKLVSVTTESQDLGAAGPEGFWELPEPKTAFLCPSPIGVRIFDTPLRFRVELLDDQTLQLLGTGSADATPECPADNLQGSCLDRCYQAD